MSALSVLAALAQETRLDIFRLLVQAGVYDAFTEKLVAAGVTSSTVSYRTRTGGPWRRTRGRVSGAAWLGTLFAMLAAVRLAAVVARVLGEEREGERVP